jgi:hypothetical protein
MALNTLTLAVTDGIKGRRFRSKIEGLTAGTEVTASGGSGGFGVLNGFLVHPALPNITTTGVDIIERDPATGETKTTSVTIETQDNEQIADRAAELVPDGAALRRFGAFGKAEDDGSLGWYVKADLTSGARIIEGLAMASGDFTNIATNNAADGVYVLNGEPVEITDIIDLAHPENIFALETNVDGDGITGAGTPIAFNITSALTTAMLASGFTIVLEYYFTGGEMQIYCSAHDEPDYDFNSSALSEYSEAFPANTRSFVSDKNGAKTYSVDAPVPAQVNKSAFTFTGTHISGSVNGGAVFTKLESALDPLMNTIQIGMGEGATCRLRAFAFYEPVDDADLPTLSALS